MRILPLLLLLAFARAALAQGPAGYYAGVDPSTPATMRTTVHNAIKDHIRYDYTAATTDTWNILEIADQDPGNPNNILDLYRNQSLLKVGGGNSFYNREHSWPNSYGFPNDVPSNYPYTDCHALFLCDSGYNTSRGNDPYRFCSSGCAEKPTVLTNGEGGPGISNWRSGSGPSGAWETWIGRRGDVARAQLYLDVRYEGGINSNSVAEPDLILTDTEALISASNTGNNESVAYMGMLSVLLQWTLQDPVDAKERARNDTVFGFQTNRNPFIDHPEYIECIFNGACSVGTAYCFGDGTGMACPCANNGAPGEGCANSLGFGGKLAAMGRASIATDTVVLTGTHMPNSSALYFQGTTQTASIFGDGIRCAAGSVIRLGTKNNASGTSQYPEANDPHISVKGLVPTAGTRTYQCWYRNAAAYCTASTFNLTNGVSVAWGS
jgi:endonuclease I